MATKIFAHDLVNMAVTKVRKPTIPYVLGGRTDNGTDCINLVGLCVQDCGGLRSDVPSGSNTAWRTVMQWKGTMAQGKAQGKLIPGSLVYILRAPTERWPDGDYGHVGIYTGPRPEFPKGHVIVHASTIYGVTTCPLEARWNAIAWLKCVDYINAKPHHNVPDITEAPHVPELTPPVVYEKLEMPLFMQPGKILRAQVETTGGVLNVRRQPQIIVDNRVGRLENGEIVDVLEIKDGWARIRSGIVHGWSQTTFLQIIGHPVPMDQPPAQTGSPDPVVIICPHCGGKAFLSGQGLG